MPEPKTFQVRIGELAVAKEIAPRGPEAPLYHYTRRDGLLGIFERREIWASNARYLNDSRELTVAIELALDLLGPPIATPSSDDDWFNADIRRFLTTIEEHWDVFVFSLSEKGDWLSQWRAYCRPGDGYSIGFDPNQLASAADKATFHLAPCRYQRGEHARLMNLVFSDARDRLHQKLQAGTPMLDARGEALTVFGAGFFMLAPLIKHVAFEEEREWRLVLPVSSVWQPRVRFRNAGTLLIPFVPIPLGSDPLPIVRVVVGPTPHPQLERRALSGLLTGHGLAKAAVDVSEVPYRLW